MGTASCAKTFEHALLLEPAAVGHCLDFVSSPILSKEACTVNISPDIDLYIYMLGLRISNFEGFHWAKGASYPTPF